MPIQHEILEPGAVLHTILIGRVTDDELLAYYWPTLPRSPGSPWREVVDGTAATEIAVTIAGQARLVARTAPHAELLKGARVAMVATNDAMFGMFRQWELGREGLGYRVRVFREREAAFAWVRGPAEASAPGEPSAGGRSL